MDHIGQTLSTLSSYNYFGLDYAYLKITRPMVYPKIYKFLHIFLKFKVLVSTQPFYQNIKGLIRIGLWNIKQTSPIICYYFDKKNRIMVFIIYLYQYTCHFIINPISKLSHNYSISYVFNLTSNLIIICYFIHMIT